MAAQKNTLPHSVTIAGVTVTAEQGTFYSERKGDLTEAFRITATSDDPARADICRRALNLVKRKLFEACVPYGALPERIEGGWQMLLSGPPQHEITGKPALGPEIVHETLDALGREAASREHLEAAETAARGR